MNPSGLKICGPLIFSFNLPRLGQVIATSDSWIDTIKNASFNLPQLGQVIATRPLHPSIRKGTLAFNLPQLGQVIATLLSDDGNQWD